jgi:nucleoside-diphosphate-sugar epimerase
MTNQANSTDLHVIFGTGPLAQSILHELMRRGQRVRMVNHSGKRPADVPQTVEIIAADLYDPQEVRRVTQGASVVYQCAQPAYTEWVVKWPLLIKSVLAGLTASKIKLVMGDNLYMYGDTNGAPFHEGLPYKAHTRKGQARAQVAELALDAHRRGAVPVTIGRGSDFYGAGVRESLAGERVFGPALAGKAAQLMGNIDLPHTLTYIEDFGKALVILGEHDSALGQAWNVPNAPTLTQREWTTLVYEALGQRPQISSANGFMVALAGLFVPAIREVGEMMYEFEKPFIVDSRKFVQAFGDHSTPHREAITATLNWYRVQEPVSSTTLKPQAVTAK